MAYKISEHCKINLETHLSSTSAGTTSGLYEMHDYDSAFIGVNVGIKGTIATISVDIFQDIDRQKLASDLRPPLLGFITSS